MGGAGYFSVMSLRKLRLKSKVDSRLREVLTALEARVKPLAGLAKAGTPLAKAQMRWSLDQQPIVAEFISTMVQSESEFDAATRLQLEGFLAYRNFWDDILAERKELRSAADAYKQALQSVDAAEKQLAHAKRLDEKKAAKHRQRARTKAGDMPVVATSDSRATADTVSPSSSSFRTTAATSAATAVAAIVVDAMQTTASSTETPVMPSSSTTASGHGDGPALRQGAGHTAMASMALAKRKEYADAARAQYERKKEGAQRVLHDNLRRGCFALCSGRMAQLRAQADAVDTALGAVASLPDVAGISEDANGAAHVTTRPFEAPPGPKHAVYPVWHKGEELTRALEVERAAGKEALAAERRRSADMAQAAARESAHEREALEAKLKVARAASAAAAAATAATAAASSTTSSSSTSSTSFSATGAANHHYPTLTNVELTRWQEATALARLTAHDLAAQAVQSSLAHTHAVYIANDTVQYIFERAAAARRIARQAEEMAPDTCDEARNTAVDLAQTLQALQLATVVAAKSFDSGTGGALLAASRDIFEASELALDAMLKVAHQSTEQIDIPTTTTTLAAATTLVGGGSGSAGGADHNSITGMCTGSNDNGWPPAAVAGMCRLVEALDTLTCLARDTFSRSALDTRVEKHATHAQQVICDALSAMDDIEAECATKPTTLTATTVTAATAAALEVTGSEEEEIEEAHLANLRVERRSQLLTEARTMMKHAKAFVDEAAEACRGVTHRDVGVGGDGTEGKARQAFKLHQMQQKEVGRNTDTTPPATDDEGLLNGFAGYDVTMRRQKWVSALEAAVGAVVEYCPAWVDMLRELLLAPSFDTVPRQSLDTFVVTTRNIAACSAQLLALVRSSQLTSTSTKPDETAAGGQTLTSSSSSSSSWSHARAIEQYSTRLVVCSRRVVTLAHQFAKGRRGSEPVDWQTLSWQKAHRLKIASQIEVVRLEQALEKERRKLGQLRHHTYDKGEKPMDATAAAALAAAAAAPATSTFTTNGIPSTPGVDIGMELEDELAGTSMPAFPDLSGPQRPHRPPPSNKAFPLTPPRLSLRATSSSDAEDWLQSSHPYEHSSGRVRGHASDASPSASPM